MKRYDPVRAENKVYMPKMEYNICENIDQLGHLKKNIGREKQNLPEIKV